MWNKFSKIFREISRSKKWKIHEKVVSHFLEFIGFISRLTSFLRFGKRSIVARDIYKFEIETVILNTINPMNSKKWVTTFSWIFHFSLIDFSWKIFENLFHKWGTPWGYMKLTTRSKKSKTYYLGKYGLLQTCSF